MMYFAYGSNMSVERLRDERGIKVKNESIAYLYNYNLVFNKLGNKRGEGFANIVPSPCDVVEGILYHIEDESVPVLDRLEGSPSHYIRTWIYVYNKNENCISQCFTYIANENMLRNGLKPTKDYMKYMLNRGIEFNKNYYTKLLNIETI